MFISEQTILKTDSESHSQTTFSFNQCVSRNPPLRSLCIPREGLPFSLACRSAINLGYTLGLPLSQPLSIHCHSGYH